MNFIYTLGAVWSIIHFAKPMPFLTPGPIETIAVFFIAIVAYIVLLLIGMFPPYRVGDKLFFLEAWQMGSVANYRGAQGRKWSKSSKVKAWSKSNKQKMHIHIDNFLFTGKVRNRLSLFGLSQMYNNMKVYVPLVGSNRAGADAVEGMLVLGSAGGGKSQFLLNIFSQNQFNRAIVHDAKGEFIKYFYRDDRDLILNSFDARGAVWDIFEEAKYNPIAVKLFFDSYIENYMEKDFWANSATLQYKKLFDDVCDLKLSSTEKWEIYTESIENLIEEYRESESRAKNSLALVMEMIQNHFIQEKEKVKKGAKMFTIHNFREQRDARLFLYNQAEFSSELVPFLTAFICSMTAIFSGKEDTKEDITLLMLDEYLTFANGINNNILTTLHTTLRSRGVMLVSALQSLPQDAEKRSLVFSNNRYYIIYPIMDEMTRKTISSLIGTVQYTQKNESSNTAGRVQKSESFALTETDAVDDVVFSTIENVNYAHITFSPTSDMLYIGKNEIFKR